MKKILFPLCIAIGALLMVGCAKVYEYPFQNPDLPIEERVENLLSLLTIEEKAEIGRAHV